MEEKFANIKIEDESELAPTLRNILDKKTLKWIFVGGKGGVGKTTCSSCLATLLSKERESVLIISTDPAHNLSDAFNQKFTRYPTLVGGFKNLFAMEIDPTMEQTDENEYEQTQSADAQMFQELAMAIPGIDEAMSFAEVMKLVQSMKFSVIVFDTAPTGHTLRLLQFPSALEKGLSRIVNLKSKFSGIFSQLSSMMNTGMESEEQVASRLEVTKSVITEVHNQFINPDMTTFICVCIPEFLSLYETERLIQELAKFQIDTDNIIVNQVLFPPPGSSCDLCLTRSKMQQKYLDQIKDLYEDFHIIKLPLLTGEIRGTENLQSFAKNLLQPYSADSKATMPH